MTSRHVTSDDDVVVTSSPPSAASSGSTSSSMLKTPAARQAPPAHPLSIGYVTAALVLGLVCLVLGLVYGYIHFTRISPRLRGARLFDHGGRADGHSSTHIFLRKSTQTL